MKLQTKRILVVIGNLRKMKGKRYKTMNEKHAINEQG